MLERAMCPPVLLLDSGRDRPCSVKVFTASSHHCNTTRACCLCDMVVVHAFFLLEIVCGSPPIIESTEQVWDGHSTPGSTVLYVCEEGFYYKDGLNISMCNENGQWTPPTLTCQGN